MKLGKLAAAAMMSAACLVLPATAQETTPPPAESFAWLPTMSGIRLSPDGQKFTASVNVENVYRYGVFEMDGEKMSPLYLISESDRVSLLSSQWANNDRIVYSVYFGGKRYNYFDSQETRLLSMKPDGSDQLSLFKFAEDDDDKIVQIQDDIISILPDDPDHILVQYGWYNRAYKVAVNRETRHDLVQAYRDGIGDWQADVHGNIRFGSGVEGEKEDRIKLIVKLENGEWKDISHRRPDLDTRFFVIGASDEPNIFYVASNEGGDTDALFAYNAATDELGEPIYRNPGADISGIIQDQDTGRAIGVSYASDEGNVHWLEDSFIRDELRKLRGAFGNKNLTVISVNPEETHMVVLLDDNKDPGQYFLYDIENKSVTGLPPQYPDLYPNDLGETLSTSYTARDGLEIQAYITLPPGIASLEEAEGLPFVLYPHGGPHARDYLGFDDWAQFMATRGYGVMQMNFRGSTGYGTQFREAGKKQWGQAMQDDITDGAQWLVDNGHADGDRLAILGASYGGYASLMGAVKTPDLYQCAVSFAGVADLPRQINDFGRRGSRHIGRLWSDRAMLRENSPVNRANEITVPVLLFHGNEDFTVDVENSRDMRNAIRRAGGDVTYIEFEGGDHYLSNYQHRLTFLQETEKFLGECLK